MGGCCFRVCVTAPTPCQDTVSEVAEKSKNTVIPSAARDLLFLDFETKSRFLVASLLGMTAFLTFSANSSTVPKNERATIGFSRCACFARVGAPCFSRGSRTSVRRNGRWVPHAPQLRVGLLKDHFPAPCQGTGLQLAEKVCFAVIPRSEATRNLLFVSNLRKSRSLAALGMTTLRLFSASCLAAEVLFVRFEFF